VYRTLFLANLNPNKFGSIEEHALFLAEEATHRGNECFLGFIAEPGPELRHRFEAAGARILHVFGGDAHCHSRLKFKEMLSLYRAVRQNNIDLIILNFFSLTDPLILGVYFTGVKIVYTEHSSGLPLRRGPLKHAISKIIHWFISRRVSKYIGVSNFVIKRIRVTHHVSGDKVVMVYNGVNLERFRPRDVFSTRREVGLPQNRPILCSVANLIPEKGIQVLLRTVAQLVHEKERTDILLVIVGEGHYRHELEHMTAELDIMDNVLFTGRRSDVHLIVSASDIVVVPSVWEEAFGLIIAEAMACGRPVVASDIGGIPELVANGITGLTVRSGDTEELMTALYQLLESPDKRREMGEAAERKATEKYDLTKQVKKLTEICDRLVC
jgi:glycosyltransferase involved in cell wall biosynthesis